MGKRTYSFDAKLLLSDNGAAYVASGPGFVGGAQRIVDMGGAPRRTDIGVVGGLARIDMGVVVDVTALNVANTNNRYVIQVTGSNTAGTLTGGVVLGSIELGNTTSLTFGGATSVPGRYEILFSTEQGDINYEYIGLYIVAQGTSPSINVTAFGVVLPEM